MVVNGMNLDLISLRQGAAEYRRLAFAKGAAMPGDPGYVERTLAENVIALVDALAAQHEQAVLGIEEAHRQMEVYRSRSPSDAVQILVRPDRPFKVEYPDPHNAEEQNHERISLEE